MGLSRPLSFRDAPIGVKFDSRTNSVIIHMRPLVPLVLKLAPILEAHFPEHPQLRHYRASADRRPYQVTDFLSHRQFRQTGIHRDVYRHLGTENQMACLLSESGATCDIGIGINRRRSDFDERERAVLELLRPHLVQARLNAQAFTQARQRIEALNAASEEVRLGIATLDREGRVDWATPKAFELLTRFFPGAVKSSGRLPELLERWGGECRRLLKGGSAAEASLSPLVVSAAGSRLKVRYAPCPDGSGRLLLSEEKDFSAREQARLMGLTAREAEVMHWIVEGKTTPEIAVILGASPRTVHKHVERIFAKLDVRTRSAAVRELMSRRAA